jgi:hypothetical protein
MYRPTALYRMYDEVGDLLYVGISYHPRYRFEQHAAEKSWFLEVDHIDTEWYQFRDLAEDAENVAIWEERPRYNIARILPRNPRWGLRARETVAVHDGLSALVEKWGAAM